MNIPQKDELLELLPDHETYYVYRIARPIPDQHVIAGPFVARFLKKAGWEAIHAKTYNVDMRFHARKLKTFLRPKTTFFVSKEPVTSEYLAPCGEVQKVLRFEDLKQGSYVQACRGHYLRADCIIEARMFDLLQFSCCGGYSRRHPLNERCPYTPVPLSEVPNDQRHPDDRETRYRELIGHNIEWKGKKFLCTPWGLMRTHSVTGDYRTHESTIMEEEHSGFKDLGVCSLMRYRT